MADLKLYNYFRSSTSYRVRIALEFKNLAYEYKPIHLVNNGGEQNSEFYRSLNPMGGVPTLEHNNKFISQSVAIIEYLEASFEDSTSIFTADEYINAKIRQTCEMINSDIHPLQNLKVTQYLEKKLNISTVQKQEWLDQWIGDGLLALEKLISPYAQTYSFGEKITAADIFIVPQIFSAKRFNVSLESYPILNRIDQNCSHHPAFIKAHPFNQPDTPTEFKK